MRAMRYAEYGGPEVLKLETQARVPEPAPGEALVRIAATSVNPADWKFRAGWFRAFVPLAMPFTPGSDVAGTIECVNGSGDLAPGDAVIGMTMPPVGGASAEFVALPLASLARAPASVALVEAAGVPLAALTAWYALFDGAGLDRGQRVLIHAAAGGVGSFAVQLARHAGADVVATASPAKHDLVRSLGASVVVDYRSDAIEALAGEIDVVLDPWGGETQARSVATLRRGGVLVTLDPTPPPPETCEAAGVRGIAAELEPDGGRLAFIVDLIDSGHVRVVVDHSYRLEELATAHARSEEGHATGKLIVEVG